MKEITIYNSLSRKKEVFTPLVEGQVGMYVCGPTVYSDVHLGNVRSFVSFDIIYRHLSYKGYNVRYVRNITDVGHLLDDGEDRVSKRAKLEKIEPMEIVQKYTNGFHNMMRIFNVTPPSIEPRATQHIIEQIEMVQHIIDNGYAYEKNGSVYFDTIKFAEETGKYGELSGRKIDELFQETRDLNNQGEKKHPSDFAIWMKAAENHIMRWNSPWSEGFPGWHLECSVMSTKYLGKTFDIHGGGSDLKFPHHENEIAQNIGSCNCEPARYWMHGNMLLMNGRKMSKSDGNTISPEELFTGDSEHVSKGYSPIVVRFFMLQTHYRSTLDISDEALLAAEKGFSRIKEARAKLDKIEAKASSETPIDKEITSLLEAAIAEMDDDFNTPKALAKLFEVVPKINGIADGKISADEISSSSIERAKEVFDGLLIDVFGLQYDEASDGKEGSIDVLMDLIIDLRQKVRSEKDWATSDKIRDKLIEAGIQLKDGKDGTSWTMN